MSRSTAALSPETEAGFDYDDCVRPLASRPPSLAPLYFGDTSWFSGIPAISERSMRSNSSIKRLTIGPSTAFRRLECTERQRRSLIPLQLEPVTLKDSVDAQSSLGLECPVDNTLGQQDHSHCTSLRTYGQDSHGAPSLESAVPIASKSLQPVQERQYKRPVLSSRSSSSSLRSLRTSSSSSLHQSIDWNRISRKRHSIRKPSSEIADSAVEQEILELNTIVEELKAVSSRSSDGQYVSAVAPLMSIMARPETLNDIGSAFSRPRPSQLDKQSGGEVASKPGDRMVLNRLSRPFTEMPELNAIIGERRSTTGEYRNSKVVLRS